jgi:hypothetical protein
MLNRCYNIYLQAGEPTYRGVKVVEEWHDFKVYDAWCEANAIEGYELDKDLLGVHYDPATCVFLPAHVNSLFTGGKATKYDLPVGVSYAKKDKRWLASLGKRSNRARFFDPAEAMLHHITLKCELIDRLCDELQDHPDSRVIPALQRCKVKTWPAERAFGNATLRRNLCTT